MKKNLLVLCLVLIGVRCYSQSVYTWDLKKDIITGSIALGIFASPFFFHNTPESVPQSPDRKTVNPFDRHWIYAYNQALDWISDYGAYGLLALPALSLTGGIADDGNAFLTYGIMLGEGVLLTVGSFNIIKSAVIRYRPYMYSGDIPPGKGQDYHNSFPSGSTSVAFFSAGFATAVFSMDHPDSPWKLPLIGASYALALGVGAGRIFSAAHFPSDVLAGAAIGSLYGYLIPFLHLNRRKNTNVGFYPSYNGFIVSARF